MSVKQGPQHSDHDVGGAGMMRDIHTIADRLGVCDKTVRRLIARGELRAHRIGRQLRISEQDYIRYLERADK